MRHSLARGVLAVVLAVAPFAPADTLVNIAPTVTGTPAGGTVDVGAPVTWTIHQPPGKYPGGLHYRLKLNNARVLQEGDIPAGQTDTSVTGKLDQPGWLYLEVVNPAADPKDAKAALATSAGVVADPAAFKPAVPRPDDFDAFWAEQLKAARAVDADPQVKEIAAEKPGVKLYEVTLNNVDGTHVHAQLARPATGDHFPALAIFQYAGVYPMQKQWATNYAAQGWLVLNVSAHDLPMYEPKAFYDDLLAGRLKDYVAIGNTSRNTSYFRHMFLGDVKMLDYLTGLPNFDGRTLVVRGESQGGMQSFVMAGLYPKVTAMIGTVPAGCDGNSPAAGRSVGWPYWANQKPADQRDKIMETARYYDPENFAATAKCAALVTIGLRDITSPPPNVLSAYNTLAGPKAFVLMPDGTHQQNHQVSQPVIDRWLTSLRTTGKPPAEQ